MSLDYGPAERVGEMRLRDGRRLGWCEWGEAAAELNVRLMAIDRPGLGRSDPHPEKPFDSWVADVRELGFSAAAAVGFSQGAPFALALAAAGVVDGAAGYARDLVNTFRPWTFAVEEIKVPVDLWYGGLDTSTVHSPDFD